MEEDKPKLTLKELMQSSQKLTDQMLSDLKQGFQYDFTVEECCLNAGIHKDTYYEWLKKSDEFAAVMERAQNFVFLAAKRNIVSSISGKYDDKKKKWIQPPSVDDAKWYLSKRQKKLYSERIEQTGVDGKDLYSPLGLDGMTPDEKLAKIKEMINDSSKTTTD